MTKEEMTLERLAEMIARGFEETATRLDKVDRPRSQNQSRPCQRRLCTIT